MPNSTGYQLFFKKFVQLNTRKLFTKICQVFCRIDYKNFKIHFLGFRHKLSRLSNSSIVYPLTDNDLTKIGNLLEKLLMKIFRRRY